MARLNTRIVSSDTENEPSTRTPNASRGLHSPPSPAQSIGSDKENAGPGASRNVKRGSGATEMSEPVYKNKRQKLTGGRDAASQTARRRELEKQDRRYYDPEQDPGERRQVRKGYRQEWAQLTDNNTEYMKAGSRGLQETLQRADRLFESVKQTSDATIDSRLLVKTADLAYRKVNTLTLGDSSNGIDVDDFITKCIGFMRRGDIEGEGRDRNVPPSTQTQRRRQRGADEEGEEGDTMNWEYLGRNACFLYNARPCLTGFLLGPLSVQKKVRQQTQRRAREVRADGTQAVRPVELKDADLDKQEDTNLTAICSEIATMLNKAQEQGVKNAEAEYEVIGEEIGEEEGKEILRKHGIADNGCIPLFNFCVNPESFGQTVENLFYVSFLIKEGRVGLAFDGNGLPTLGMAADRTVKERQETTRNQAVFTIDFDLWEDIIETYGIQKSVIPNRREVKYDDGTIGSIPVSTEEDSDAYL